MVRSFFIAILAPAAIIGCKSSEPDLRQAFERTVQRTTEGTSPLVEDTSALTETHQDKLLKEVLREALKSQNPIRVEAALTIADVRHDPDFEVSALQELTVPDYRSRSSAASYLVSIHSKRAKTTLLKLAKSPTGPAYGSVLTAIAGLKITEASPTLCDLLGHVDSHIEPQIVDAIGELGLKSSQASLHQRMKTASTSDTLLRTALTRAIERIK